MSTLPQRVWQSSVGTLDEAVRASLPVFSPGMSVVWNTAQDGPLANQATAKQYRTQYGGGPFTINTVIAVPEWQQGPVGHTQQVTINGPRGSICDVTGQPAILSGTFFIPA